MIGVSANLLDVFCKSVKICYYLLTRNSWWMNMPKIKAKSKLVENIRSIVDNSRTHSLIWDLSKAAGVSDSGPIALELALMALTELRCNDIRWCLQKKYYRTRKSWVVGEAEKSQIPLVFGLTMSVAISAKARKNSRKLLGDEQKPIVSFCHFQRARQVKIEPEVKPK